MKELMLSHARLLVVPVVMALALVGAACVQQRDDVSEACPTGLRIVQDPLSEAPDLSCTDLKGADLRMADLSGADLSGADLSGADLSWADLGDAKMIKTNLSGANLTGANPSGADLSGANVGNANLSGANLSGANLSGANLGEVDIITAILTGSASLDWPNLNDAIYDSTTQLPPGIDPEAIGMTLASEE